MLPHLLPVHIEFGQLPRAGRKEKEKRTPILGGLRAFGAHDRARCLDGSPEGGAECQPFRDFGGLSRRLQTGGLSRELGDLWLRRCRPSALCMATLKKCSIRCPIICAQPGEGCSKCVCMSNSFVPNSELGADLCPWRRFRASGLGSAWPRASRAKKTVRAAELGRPLAQGGFL